MVDGPASTADVQAFVTTANAGSFAAGAKRLGLSRSAVAKAVGRLEARLGTRLMTRSTRRLALTEDGRRFHARCSAALDELAAAEADVAQGSDGGDAPRGLLRLTAPDAYGRLRVMPVVARYLALHPAVEVELGLSDRVSGVVTEGLDLAIRIGLPEDLPPDLVGRVIDRLGHGFFAAPAYLATRGRPETLADLSMHDGIAYGTAHPRRWRALSLEGDWRSLEGRVRISADSGEGVLQAAVAGLGVAVMPDFLAREAVERGTLEQVLSGVPLGELTVVVLYPSRRHLPHRVRTFLDLLGAREADHLGRLRPDRGRAAEAGTCVVPPAAG